MKGIRVNVNIRAPATPRQIACNPDIPSPCTRCGTPSILPVQALPKNLIRDAMPIDWSAAVPAPAAKSPVEQKDPPDKK